MPLYQNSVLNKYLKSQDEKILKDAYDSFTAYFHSPERQENIRNSKEEQFQEGFLRELFVKILGYTLNPEPNYNLTTELKNEKGAKKTDGAIVKNSKALAVIELKGTDTKDLDKVNDQAFNYKNNHSECVYVVTSNFEKLRFFIHNAVEHIEFDLFQLSYEDFKILWLCLEANNLLENLPLKVKEESIVEEEKITKYLYRDYSSFKNDLWQNLCELNPDKDQLLLFKKTQKLLDRFLFIFFAEDGGLLPPNSISRMVERYDQLIELDAYKPLYEIFKQYFGYINKGRKGKTSEDDIFAYNGGLFIEDEILDSLKLDDEILKKHILTLTAYDFESEIDVNILGHIFENSLNEIENIKAKLEGQEIERSKTKRKKDGVFYTPKYVTKFIVDTTLGRLCEDKKKQLDILDEEYAKGRRNRKKDIIKRLDNSLQNYREWLLNITICDPACGSGAFLNQALEFLMEEHSYIDELESQLMGMAMTFPGVENHILEKNIYGVDINEESVEIAKLSLWLRTAQRGRKLTSLNNNIKCGNSLIDDIEIGGEKAFGWQTEFKNVFDKGGFDVIIGNPPYVLCQPSNTPENLLSAYKNFEVASYKVDLFHLFFEKSITILNDQGMLGFITPNTYLTNKYMQPLRSYILNHTDIIDVVSHKEAVFADASVDVATITLSKIKEDARVITLYESQGGIIYESGNKEQKDWEIDANNIFNVKTGFSLDTEDCTNLGEICKTYFGIQAYDRKSSISVNKEDDKHLPIIDGGDIHPYVYSEPTKYFNYRDENIKSGGDWKVYSTERIVIRQIGQTPVVGMCAENILASNTLYSVFLKDEKSDISLIYLLGILNSSLIKEFWLSRYSDGKKLFPKIKGYQLKELPINISNPENRSQMEKLVKDRIEVSTLLAKKEDSFSEFLESKLSNFDSNSASWLTNDFNYFVDAIKKAKIKLSISEEAEWMNYFNNEKEAVESFQKQIFIIDTKIDQLTCEIYGVPPELLNSLNKN